MIIKIMSQSLYTVCVLTRHNGSFNQQFWDMFSADVDNRQLREEFAKACFETLLQFSFISQTKPVRDATDEGALTKMALASLLQRCQEVLKKYVEDERLSGKCPLPR